LKVTAAASWTGRSSCDVEEVKAMRSRMVVVAMVFILAAVTVTWAGGKQEGATGTAGGKVSITWML